MKNLSGRARRNILAEEEFRSLKINVLHLENSLFPPYGVRGHIYFYRAPTSWLAVGSVPLVTAEKLYQDGLGYAQILVVANNTRPSPSEKRKKDFRAADTGRILAKKGSYTWAKLDDSLGWVIPFYRILDYNAVRFFLETLAVDNVIK